MRESAAFVGAHFVLYRKLAQNRVKVLAIFPILAAFLRLGTEITELQIFETFLWVFVRANYSVNSCLVIFFEIS